MQSDPANRWAQKDGRREEMAAGDQLALFRLDAGFSGLLLGGKGTDLLVFGAGAGMVGFLPGGGRHVAVAGGSMPKAQ